MTMEVRPLPLRLRWRRGTFVVMIDQLGLEPVAAEVEGLRADPFGIYRGGPFGPDLLSNHHQFTLALIPSRLRVVTTALQIDCKDLALRLASLRVNWAAEASEEIQGEDLPHAREILHRQRTERAGRQSTSHDGPR